MSYIAGGQTRTLICGCGWSCRKQLQEANKLFKLHKKLSHKEKPKNLTEFSQEQGVQGIHYSKNGNRKYKPLIITDIINFPEKITS